MREVRRVEPSSNAIPAWKRVAAYCRVSSGKDAMLNSLSAQVSYYSSYIQKQRGWEYAGVYADEAFTGTKEERPEFQRLMNDCKDGKIDIVLTKSISRFARNTVTMLEAVRELKSMNVDVWFERENIRSMSGDGELMLTILASFAQEESRSVSENCKWRIRDKMKKGEMVGFFGMYGYDYKEGEITVNEVQAAVIRQMFEWYIGGLGVTAIAHRLNEQGIPAHMGGRWHHARVGAILANEKLTGNSLLQKKFSTDHLTKKQQRNRGEMPRYYAEKTHSAIISIEVFETAKKIRQERAEHFNADDNSKNIYPFSGKITCGLCGKKYKRKKGVGKFYWQCSTYLQESKAVCPAEQISEDILQQIADIDFKEIRIPKHNTIIIITPDGAEVERFWQYKSRRESWTDEMRQAARERTLQRQGGTKK